MPTLPRPILLIRLTHLGRYADGRPNSSAILIPDLDVGYENQDRKVPVYVPPSGFIDIPASSRSMLSFEKGGIYKLTSVGLIHSKMFWMPESFTTATLPPATQYPSGTHVWNETNQTTYWSDGTQWVAGSRPVGPASGDLSGSYPAPTVVRIQGIPFESGTPANGDAALYNAATNTWEHSPITFSGGPPTGGASNDLGGLYPGPTVVGLQQDLLPAKVGNGFLKRNAVNTAWEEVTYGSSTNTVCQGNDVRLSDARIPTGTALGDLSGTYPSPSIAPLAVTDAKVAVANKDGLAAVPSMRTLGTGAQQACAGNDARLSDSRPPSGVASGDLSGNYPSPTVVGLQSRPVAATAPTVDAALTWNGTAWTPQAGGTPSGAYPVVTITANHAASAWQVILANTAAGNLTVTLPLAAGCVGKPINIKKVSPDGYQMNVTGQGGQLIDGQAIHTVTGQHNSMTVISDGSNWWII